ncbi:MAG: hypothetical protein EHM89_19540, partial [Acidobacteria bacterium]
MKKFVVAALAVLLQANGLAAQQRSTEAGQVHGHDAVDHDTVAHLTLNVAVSDAGIQPSML